MLDEASVKIGKWDDRKGKTKSDWSSDPRIYSCLPCRDCVCNSLHTCWVQHWGCTTVALVPDLCYTGILLIFHATSHKYFWTRFHNRMHLFDERSLLFIRDCSPFCILTSLSTSQSKTHWLHHWFYGHPCGLFNIDEFNLVILCGNMRPVISIPLYLEPQHAVFPHSV